MNVEASLTVRFYIQISEWTLRTLTILCPWLHFHRENLWIWMEYSLSNNKGNLCGFALSSSRMHLSFGSQTWKCAAGYSHGAKNYGFWFVKVHWWKSVYDIYSQCCWNTVSSSSWSSFLLLKWNCECHDASDHIISCRGYMARELIDNQKISSKSDIFSLGIIMARLLTGSNGSITELVRIIYLTFLVTFLE